MAEVTTTTKPKRIQRLQIGLQEPLSDAELAIGIPPDHPTIASQMKKAGYDTALIGKWHLGNLEQFGPNHHGFDEFFGINGSSAGTRAPGK